MRRYILQHTLLLLELDIVLPVNVSETPLAGDDDLLATRELVTGAAERLLNDGSVRVLGADREDDLADVDTGNSTIWLAPCATHTGLQTIVITLMHRLLVSVHILYLPISTST